MPRIPEQCRWGGQALAQSKLTRESITCAYDGGCNATFRDGKMIGGSGRCTAVLAGIENAESTIQRSERQKTGDPKHDQKIESLTQGVRDHLAKLKEERPNFGV